MGLKFNGAEIDESLGKVVFNGANVEKIIFNGSVVWTSTPSSTIPAPSFLEASDGSYADRIGIMWGYSGQNLTYRLERRKDGETDWVVVADIPWVDLTYDDTSINPGDVYWYRVKAVGDDGVSESDYSPADSGYADVAVGPQPPTKAPQNLSASDGTYWDRVRITWDASEEKNATGTQIIRNGIVVKIVDFKETFWEDFNVEQGVHYVYSARFMNSDGVGPESNEDSGYSDVGHDCYDPSYICPQGHGSELDADKLDGKHATYFAEAAHTHSPSDISPQGGGSGLNADMVDGYHASYFQRSMDDLSSPTIAANRNDEAPGSAGLTFVNSNTTGLKAQIWAYAGGNFMIRNQTGGELFITGGTNGLYMKTNVDPASTDIPGVTISYNDPSESGGLGYAALNEAGDDTSIPRVFGGVFVQTPGKNVNGVYAAGVYTRYINDSGAVVVKSFGVDENSAFADTTFRARGFELTDKNGSVIMNLVKEIEKLRLEVDQLKTKLHEER